MLIVSLLLQEESDSDIENTYLGMGDGNCRDRMEWKMKGTRMKEFYSKVQTNF
jgi:hypothetical protein